MENQQENNLKNALVQLKAASQDVDLVQNDLVEQSDELDSVKENITNAIQSIKESLIK
jgi:hypothetical protein